VANSGSVFSAQIAAFCAKAQGNADLVVRKVAFEMFSRVIQKTPVDTGRAKSSWVVSINAVPTDVPIAFDKSGASSIERVTATTLEMKAGDTITMCSNLTYSRRLEYGWSGQAPNGMVRITVQEFNGVVVDAASIYAGIGPWQPRK
jgi:hypothetical protein